MKTEKRQTKRKDVTHIFDTNGLSVNILTRELRKEEGKLYAQGYRHIKIVSEAGLYGTVVYLQGWKN